MFQVMPGGQQALAYNPFAQMLASNELINPAVAQMLLGNPVMRADPRVQGGVTGVPAMQGMINGNIDVQYGVRLPQALVKKFMTDTPLLDRILSFGSVTRPERAAVYGTFDSMDFSAGQYGDFTIGGDPPGIKGSRSFGSKVKKSYGAMASITDVDAIASGANGYPTRYGDETVTDDRQLLLRYCAVKTLTALEYSIVKGNESSRPTQFDGIETALTSSTSNWVVDLNGATTGIFAAINNMLLAMASKGIRVSELWMHPLTKQAVIAEYLGQTGHTINITQGNENMLLGQQANQIVTAVGTLPIVESYHFTLGGTSPNLSGDVFLIARDKDGIPLFNFEWMVEPRAIEPLARVPGFYTSSVMGVWCHGVLYERSNYWAQGRIRNYGFNFNTTTYPVATMTP
jgi:hypothetical protein